MRLPDWWAWSRPARLWAAVSVVALVALSLSGAGA
jgi:hypothetical protein